tara:strand:+ start:862 stop:1290 length:429 start_codon:yes stop_codon:yes gene_type:complete
MPTTTAAITITNDIGSAPISITKTMTLNKAASATLGMDTLLSVSKVLASVNQVDLIAAASAGSTAHNFLYINNPSTDASEFFTLVLGDDPQGASADSVDEELGRLYGGDWMFIPWSAANTSSDIMIAPSVATDMTVEFMVFS